MLKVGKLYYSRPDPACGSSPRWPLFAGSVGNNIVGAYSDLDLLLLLEYIPSSESPSGWIAANVLTPEGLVGWAALKLAGGEP